MGEPLVVFEDPPLATNAGASGRWTAALEVLKANPGLWGRIGLLPSRKRATGAASSLTKQKVYISLAGDGRFEGVSRSLGDGQYGVWARYHPPAVPVERLEGEQHLDDVVAEVGLQALADQPAESMKPQVAEAEAGADPPATQESTPPRQVEAASPPPASAAAPRRRFSEQARQQGDRIRGTLSLVQRQHLLGLARQWDGGEGFTVKLNVARPLMNLRLIEDSKDVRAALVAGHRDGSHYPLTDVGEYLAAKERGGHQVEDIAGASSVDVDEEGEEA